jgi:hypothetical protein
MTDGELNAFVISKWTNEHAPHFIMLYLVCLGRPVSRREVMTIIKKYIDVNSENTTLGKMVRK